MRKDDHECGSSYLKLGSNARLVPQTVQDL